MGTIFGLKVAGYSTCPLCGPDLHGRYSTLVRKMTYEGARQRLPLNHPLRHDRTYWKRPDLMPVPNGPSSEAQLQMAKLISAKLATTQDTGVDWCSCLWNLPYWRVNPLTQHYSSIVYCLFVFQMHLQFLRPVHVADVTDTMFN